MTKLRDEYFAVLALSQDDYVRRLQMRRALNRAYAQRTFEIEHYWKRSTYFWGFQIAIFAAFGLLWRAQCDNQWGPITLGLSILGIFTALANSLSARGSKFWQENWEKHIDMLEDEFEGRLYKTVWLSDGKVGFSVSRINKRLSDYLVLFWFLVTLYVGWQVLVTSSVSIPNYIPTSWVFAGFAVLLAVTGIVGLFSQISDAHGTLPQADGSRGTRIHRRWWWSRVIPGAAAPPFIRRDAPDEDQ